MLGIGARGSLSRRALLASGLATVAFGIALTAITGSPLALLAVAFGAADIALGAGLRWGRRRDRDGAGAPGPKEPRPMELRSRPDSSEVQTSNGDPAGDED